MTDSQHRPLWTDALAGRYPGAVSFALKLNYGAECRTAATGTGPLVDRRLPGGILRKDHDTAHGPHEASEPGLAGSLRLVWHRLLPLFPSNDFTRRDVMSGNQHGVPRRQHWDPLGGAYRRMAMAIRSNSGTPSTATSSGSRHMIPTTFCGPDKVHHAQRYRKGTPGQRWIFGTIINTREETSSIANRRLAGHGVPGHSDVRRNATANWGHGPAGDDARRDGQITCTATASEATTIGNCHEGSPTAHHHRTCWWTMLPGRRRSLNGALQRTSITPGTSGPVRAGASTRRTDTACGLTAVRRRGPASPMSALRQQRSLL